MVKLLSWLSAIRSGCALLLQVLPLIPSSSTNPKERDAPEIHDDDPEENSTSAAGADEVQKGESSNS